MLEAVEKFTYFSKILSLVVDNSSSKEGRLVLVEEILYKKKYRQYDQICRWNNLF